ncbi:hypothetical protein JDV02_002661 [Purpureocillium takamizusanense]|uniref:Orc1-like AAA ATPase domain-containing protein n=1 Tax=Purpureocillium takamizusanense TaxID=2060973 RepID=A0A9Q8QC27_9HYPO|nr:uncharacterized protein JDV02_002661 [Purpureocillium takamizusanense]UNI16201.1 hypothetical protein JDV02_002661 [Purpureocillium takamizusanense]
MVNGIMAPLFRLPDEELLTSLAERFPGREQQIRSLATLLHPDAAPCRNLVLHGTEATGKSAITSQLLSQLAALSRRDEGGDGDVEVNGSSKDTGEPNLRYAFVNAAQCITGRHLFERVVGAVADALRCDARDDDERHRWDQQRRRCETLAQLTVALGTMLRDPTRQPRSRFVLVLDAIDRQRDAPPTLLPALARLSEMIPCLTCVFIVTAPPAGFLRTPSAPHLHFPPYTKPEFVRILALAPPPPIPGTTERETADLWTRFCAAVHDAFVRSAARTLPAFRHGCRALWPRFIAPVVAGTYAVKEFSKLLVAARVHFQDESLLNPSIVSLRPGAGGKSTAALGDGPAPIPVDQAVNGVSKATTTTTTHTITAAPAPAAAQLTALLPIAARILLLCAYLASHNAARHDLTVFSTYHHGRRRRRGGGFTAAAAGGGGSSTPRRGAKHRKIARKLLGAHAFVLERMLAIFEAVRGEWIPEGGSVGSVVDGDVGMAISTLASLRLLVRVGAGDTMDRAGKWRINVGWDAIRGIGRSIGVEVEEWLME